MAGSRKKAPPADAPAPASTDGEVARKTLRRSEASYARRADANRPGGSDGDADKTPEAKAETKPSAEAKPVAESRPAAPEKPAPVAESKPAAPEKPAPVAESRPAAAEKPAPVAETKPAAAEKPAPVAETKPAAPEKPAPVAETKPAAPEPPAPAAAEPPAEEPAAPVYAEMVPYRQVDLRADPEAPAPPPGLALPGDCRSMRRVAGGVEEFVLVYRDQTHLITRRGVVGKQGSWTMVDYPSQGSACHAYAMTCSDLGGEGFVDLR